MIFMECYRRACWIGVTIESWREQPRTRVSRAMGASPNLPCPRFEEKLTRISKTHREIQQKAAHAQGNLNAKWLSGVAHGSRARADPDVFRQRRSHRRRQGHSPDGEGQGARYVAGPRTPVSDQSISALGGRSQSGFQQGTVWKSGSMKSTSGTRSGFFATRARLWSWRGRNARNPGLNAMDGLHVAAAHLLRADEFVTTESQPSPSTAPLSSRSSTCSGRLGFQPVPLLRERGVRHGPGGLPTRRRMPSCPTEPS